MRAINPPQLIFTDVINTCINSISDDVLKQKFNAITLNLNTAAINFDIKAATSDLFQIPIFNENDSSIVTGGVTKKELKDLYTLHMVPQSKPARAYYDQIKMSAPLNICPFCGFGHVTTLDHYLPKAKYPLLSVLPKNLIPSCADCNKGKSSGVATTKNKQCLNPYFDQGIFINEQWLFAEVIETMPPTIRYFVQAPLHWSADDKLRVNSHFVDFKLANRFRTQAGTELPNLKGELEYDFQLTQDVGVRQALQRKAVVAASQHPNSWKTAMYQTLADSNWYCSGGFR